MEQVHKPYGPYEKYFKRPLDIFCGLAAVIVFSWLYLILIILGAIFMRGNPFFTQERPGLHGKIFKIYKFKTMNDARDGSGNLLPDSERLTPVGSFIRKLSLDELPQLWNVLKGDMSLIGPRPLLPQYLPLYSEEQARRHDVRPGITGWAQVNGRNAISWTQKFVLDCYYVDNISFALDVKILFMTIKKVIIREGISQEGNATMEFFDGTN